MIVPAIIFIFEIVCSSPPHTRYPNSASSSPGSRAHELTRLRLNMTDVDTQLSGIVLAVGLVLAEVQYAASVSYLWVIMALGGVCAPMAVGFCLTDFFDAWAAFTVVIIVAALLLLMLVGVIGIPASIGIDISVVCMRLCVCVRVCVS